ncbi:uncharacterized protein FOMMEDRAFT_144109 [Fomitiporia mediterranea MF3/22]|uniref:uncharacterized protein n=1 Tax=Fomitiporia mediterranea (strain MF3/22) TaxID=694068 RepID=UPI0004408CE2|nr:uncharacterized protein FOMMEDRAFT_144109 [Fomitiporia mediterranea MF3/22]EJD07925.1 hypothetical protein FOMMEDRAFT_144109 [Fomitiporia mediterranea MF3/22]
MVRSALKLFYDVGTAFGVLGFLLGFGVLVYASTQFLSVILSNHEVSQHRLMKRATEVSGMGETSTLAVNLIIPGVTVPQSHIWFILLALFSAQCLHEAGHAIAGAIEGLPLQAVGASLTVVLPSAFVSFSSSMDSMALETSRLRVIASGAWHNFLLWGTIYLASFMNFSSLWSALGYRDASDFGLVVLEIEEGSPLTYYLQPGNVIVSLDDVALGTTNTSRQTSPEDLWSQLLLRHDPLIAEQGWCIDSDTFSDQPMTCCNSRVAKGIPAHPPAAQLSCFVPIQAFGNGQGRCVDPIPILSPNPSTSPAGRCFSAKDCDEHTAEQDAMGKPKECVRPDLSAQLLRIGVSPPIWEIDLTSKEVNNETRTVLWSGPREEVWEQVKVGSLSPRHQILPLWLPNSLSLFFSYLSTLSFSLYIFNLFALPFLDGSHFLSALIDLCGSTRANESSLLDAYTADDRPEFSHDIELGVASENSDNDFIMRRTGTRIRFSSSLATLISKWRRRIRRRKDRIERVVKSVTIGLMCFALVGMIWPR